MKKIRIGLLVGILALGLEAGAVATRQELRALVLQHSQSGDRPAAKAQALSGASGLNFELSKQLVQDPTNQALLAQAYTQLGLPAEGTPAAVAARRSSNDESSEDVSFSDRSSRAASPVRPEVKPRSRSMSPSTGFAPPPPPPPPPSFNVAPPSFDAAPPPPPPPPPSFNPAPPAGDPRAALLAALQGGTKLKKAVTNDRSAPAVPDEKEEEGARTNPLALAAAKRAAELKNRGFQDPRDNRPQAASASPAPSWAKKRPASPSASAAPVPHVSGSTSPKPRPPVTARPVVEASPVKALKAQIRAAERKEAEARKEREGLQAELQKAMDDSDA